MKFETEMSKQTWVTLPKPCRLQSPETEKSHMATRQPFRKCGHWKSIGFYSYTQALGHWNMEFVFKAKLKLESGNQKIQYGCQAAILKLTSLKINRLLLISTVPLKFGVDFQDQTKVRVWNPKIQYGRQAAILKLMSLKINRLLPIYISIVSLKFWVDVHSQMKVRVWKPKIPKWPPGGHFESDVVENQ